MHFHKHDIENDGNKVYMLRVVTCKANEQQLKKSMQILHWVITI